MVIAPSTDQTRGIVSKEVLDALGPEGCLVKVARGDLVNEEALIAGLSSGEIAGAALDVFAQEPHVPDALRELSNVVLLRHHNSATVKTRRAMGDQVVRNRRAHLHGDPVLTPMA